MRPAMRPATKRVLAAALTALVVGSGVDAMATGSPAPAGAPSKAPTVGPTSYDADTAPASYGYLRARVFRAPGLGTIAVGAPDPRRVMVQERDDASGTWSAPRLLFRGEDGVTCGDISGRASAGGVALLLECDTPYYDDQAPAASVALVTQDLRTWSRHELPGEAYRAPAISPDGTQAVWLAGGIGDFVQWGAGTGFSTLRSTTYDYDGGGGSTAVVTDDGTVGVLGPENGDDSCVVGVHERSPEGRLSAYQVQGVDPGCTEGDLQNRSALEVVGGGSERADRFSLTRPDAASRWQLGSIAPASAPGLVDYRGGPRRVIATSFSDVPGQPLVAYGSPDRSRVFTQRYDESAQEWGARTQVYDHGFPACAAEGTFGQRRSAVHAIALHCYRARRQGGDYPASTPGYQTAPPFQIQALLSVDGVDWRTVDLAGSPLGRSADRRLVAAPGLRSTTIASPAGIAVLPVTAPARCGFVHPIGPERLLRLHGSAGSGWPRVLQRFDGEGWRTIQRVHMPRTGACTRIRSIDDFSPTTYLLGGSGQRVALRVVRRDGAWRVVRPAGF